jgi:hypothetical protein
LFLQVLFVAAISRTSAVNVLLEPTRSKVRSPRKAQQLDLQRRVDLPDLIQKKRPALRLLEAPDPPFVRAGEGPFFVPEQLALQQSRAKAPRNAP